ncbi:MAG: polymer-forming cytoskeletal protein [Candidatus Eisenbacteria bacterium]|nr:polymer-forming cytoskeletal protein [Candidatus Eisenbacteria bacterium]
MARTDNPEGTEKVASIIAEGCTFNGTVNVSGNIRVDGRFDGKLIVSDTLVIGKTGKVRAEVETKVATIAGNLNGEIHAREGVKLQAGSHFEGNIYTKNLVIEEGVFFDGGCWRSVEGKGKAESRPQPKPEKQAAPAGAPTGVSGPGR